LSRNENIGVSRTFLSGNFKHFSIHPDSRRATRSEEVFSLFTFHSKRSPHPFHALAMTKSNNFIARRRVPTWQSVFE